MFDFAFGGKRKLALIRELLEQRMREDGFDDMDSRLKVKELGRLQLLSTPEGAIVTIVETVVKSQKQGALLGSILSSIEEHRKSLGSDPEAFAEILNLASGPDAGESVGAYCFYRVELESPGRVAFHQCMRALGHAASEITSW